MTPTRRLAFVICSMLALASNAQTHSGPIVTPQVNQKLYVGQTGYSTIQLAVNFACKTGTQSYEVIIEAGMSPSDSPTSVTRGCSGTYILDQRTVLPLSYQWNGSSYALVASGGGGGGGGASLPTNAVVYGLSATTSRAAGVNDITPLWNDPSCVGSPFLKKDGTCGIGGAPLPPNALVYGLTTTTSRAAIMQDVANLWTDPSCTGSPFLKKDGTCGIGGATLHPNAVVYALTATTSRAAAVNDIAPLWIDPSCVGSPYLKKDGTCGLGGAPLPANAVVYGLTAATSRAAIMQDIANLWTDPSCTGGTTAAPSGLTASIVGARRRREILPGVKGGKSAHLFMMLDGTCSAGGSGGGGTGPQYHIAAYTGIGSGSNYAQGYSNSYTDATGNNLWVPGTFLSQQLNALWSVDYANTGGNGGGANGLHNVLTNPAFTAQPAASMLLGPTYTEYDQAPGDQYLTAGDALMRSFIDYRQGYMEFTSMNPGPYHGYSSNSFGFNCQSSRTTASPNGLYPEPQSANCISINYNSTIPGYYHGALAPAEPSGGFQTGGLYINANIYSASMNKSLFSGYMNQYGSGDTQVHAFNYVNDYGGQEYSADEGFHIDRIFSTVGLQEFTATVGSTNPAHGAGYTQLWFSAAVNNSLGVGRLLIDTTKAIADSITAVGTDSSSGAGTLTMNASTYPVSVRVQVAANISPPFSNYNTKFPIAVLVNTGTDLKTTAPITSTGPKVGFVGLGTAECATVQSYGNFGQSSPGVPSANQQVINLLLSDFHGQGENVFIGGMACDALVIDGDVTNGIKSTYYVFGSTANNTLIAGRMIGGNRDNAFLRPAAVHVYPAARVLDVRPIGTGGDPDNFVKVEETGAFSVGDNVEAGLVATAQNDTFYYNLTDNSPYTRGSTYWYILGGNQGGNGRDFTFVQNHSVTPGGAMFHWQGPMGTVFRVESPIQGSFLEDYQAGTFNLFSLYNGQLQFIPGNPSTFALMGNLQIGDTGSATRMADFEQNAINLNTTTTIQSHDGPGSTSLTVTENTSSSASPALRVNGRSVTGSPLGRFFKVLEPTAFPGGDPDLANYGTVLSYEMSNIHGTNKGETDLVSVSYTAGTYGQGGFEWFATQPGNPGASLTNNPMMTLDSLGNLWVNSVQCSGTPCGSGGGGGGGTATSIAPPQNRLGGSLTLATAPDNGQGDRHFFDFRNLNDEFDSVSGTPTYNNGVISGSITGKRNLDGTYSNYSISCAMYFAPATMTLTACGANLTTYFYGAAFYDFGGTRSFGWFNSGGFHSLATPAADAWYWVNFTVDNGYSTVSYCPLGTTLGCGTFVTETSGAQTANALQIQTASSTDQMSTFRYAAAKQSGISNIVAVPNFNGATEYSTPINLQVPSNPAGSRVNLMVELPPNYNLRASTPWVMWIHGRGGTIADMFGSLSNPMAEAFLNAGYVVVASDYTNLSCWGNAACVADMQTALKQAMLQFNLDPKPYCYAGSMGGIVMLNAISHGTLTCRAAEMSFPVYDLSSIYQNGSGNPGFVTDIQTAYGFSGPSGYAAATAGYDPALTATSTFATTPMDVHCSASDTTVPCSTNGQALVTAVNAAGGNSVFTACSGPHGDPSCMTTAAAIDFFKQH